MVAIPSAESGKNTAVPQASSMSFTPLKKGRYFIAPGGRKIGNKHVARAVRHVAATRGNISFLGKETLMTPKCNERR